MDFLINNFAEMANFAGVIFLGYWLGRMTLFSYRSWLYMELVELIAYGMLACAMLFGRGEFYFGRVFLDYSRNSWQGDWLVAYPSIPLWFCLAMAIRRLCFILMEWAEFKSGERKDQQFE